METTSDNRQSIPRPRAVPAKLDAIIRRLRLRWRCRRMLRGSALILAAFTLTLLLASLLLAELHFAPPAVWALRGVCLLVLLGTLFSYCYQPLAQPLHDDQVALYLEEHEPELGGIVIGAVDASRKQRDDLSPQLVDGLVERAAQACGKIEFGDRIERPRLKREAAILGLIALVITLLALLPPTFLRHGALALLQPWTKPVEYSPYRIELSPGDTELARGGDVLISARITGFDGDNVMLWTSNDGGEVWHSVEMAFATEPGLYESFLFDVARDVDYYVAGASQQSLIYRIAVADIPAIEKIELRYRFPAYTQLEPRLSEGSGDISALRGTRVEVSITPTIEIPGGALVFGEQHRIELEPAGDGRWHGEIEVEADANYRVALQRPSGIEVNASPEYRITALDDLQPSVSIASPGRDMKVSMVEEPLMKIQANDDLGISSLELVMSINGDDKQTIELLRNSSPQRRVEAEHVVYLEQLNLRPGDLISYYVNAHDRAPDAAAKTTTSDIFFYQVRPFDAIYRRAEQQGGGGGGSEGGQGSGFLSEQQKQFVIATFKMIRDRNQYDDDAYRENLELLARAEGRIRDRVQAIMRRIGSRALIQVDERYRVITAELPQAVERMREVENQLHREQVEAALGDAQVALKHLQRADAAFKEINVSLANRGGSGSNSSSGFEDLANLFQLEMDKLRHQYESVQRGKQRQSSEALVDETLEKLRQLAQRQQQEVERQLRRRGQASTDAARERQLALAEELEEMARRLERLSRNQPNPRLQQSVEQMQRAAAAMRRSSGTAGSDNLQQARRAASDLREAQRLLDQSRTAKFAEAIKRTLKRAELVEKKQQRIKQDVSDLDPDWGEKLKAQLRQLDRRKHELGTELANLENEVSSLSKAARDDQPKANESLKQAIRAAREARLHDRIGRTREMILLNQREHAEENESQIQRGIAQLRENLENALAGVGEPQQRGLERSLDQMRAIARELQYLQQRDGNGSRQSSGTGGGADADSRWPQEIRGIAERSGELRGALIRQGVAPGDVDPVIERIQQLASGDHNSHSEQQQLALQALMELEYKLRRELESHEYPQLLSDGAEIPDGYESLVADYFRQLSRQ